MTSTTNLSWSRLTTGLNLPTIAVGAVTLTIASLFPRTRRSYNNWYALGPAGFVPHNILGWIVQGLMAVIAKGETLDTSPFRDPKVLRLYDGLDGQSSFLPSSPLPKRSRPNVPFVVFPQRQTDHSAPESIVQQMEAYLHALASANASLLQVKGSRLEGIGNPALYLASGRSHPLLTARMQGEIVHRHYEGSSHMVLSLADAELVLLKGWGERFRLSGVVVPWTYTMVYAPRDEEELEAWKGLVLASARFMYATAREEVQDLKGV